MSDEDYELDHRDGYELAVQDIDVAIGNDGEFKASTLPGESVGVHEMKQRIIDRTAELEDMVRRLVGELGQAQNGLEWWMAEYPEPVCEVDHQMIKSINAIKAEAAQLVPEKEIEG